MILFIGPFPPPVHGASAVTQRAFESLRAANLELSPVDVSPNGRGIQYHISRFSRFWLCWSRLFTIKDDTVVYVSLSGGGGLIYDVVTAAVIYLRRFRVVYHHHSYAYISQRSPLVALILTLSLKAQTHVFLSEGMKCDFTERYGSCNGVVVSNLAFFPAKLADARVGSLRVIGYLSNITFEKGLDRFLDLMAQLKASGSELTARIAGPVGDDQVRAALERSVSEIGNIEYVGPVYDEKKDEYYDSIDFFIFPTRYVNEAQPMTVYEAQLAGLPVAVSDRGCLADMCGPNDILLDPNSSNLSVLVNTLIMYENDREAFDRVKAACVARQRALLEEAARSKQTFLQCFFG